MSETSRTPAAGARIPRASSGRLFLGDGGLETTMILAEGIELPCFASFLLLRERVGLDVLRRYYRGYLELATRHGLGFTLDTPTWRANADCGEKLGYPESGLADVNRAPVAVGEAIERVGEAIERVGEVIERVDAATDGSRRRRGLLHGQLRPPGSTSPTRSPAEDRGSGAWPACACTPRGAATPSSISRPSSTQRPRTCSGPAYATLERYVPELRVLGGCCGTDERHIASSCRGWLS